MKFAAIVFAILALAVLVFGSPLPVDRPQYGNHWESPVSILPMTFGHDDHTEQSCIACHHNYVDDTGTDTCMHCHVTDETVSGLLMEQFHELCMGCHRDEATLGNAHGPLRQCIGCHLEEDIP